LLGRKKISKTNLGKLSTAANSFGRASKHKDDVGRAESKKEDLEAELARLETEMGDELAAVRDAWTPEALELGEIEVAPRKSDIAVKRVALAWVKK
ncbi:MAG: ATP-binding protein, partial [Gemmatimonadota bacterium]